MTLHEWLQKGEAQLRRSPHPDRAREDAELLLCHATQHNKAGLLARWNDGMEAAQADRFGGWIERRMTGEPIQYILGETEFYGLPFRVTRDVLIPRPETEHVVETVAALAAPFSAPRIVDVGAGAGAIAVALAHVLPQSQVTAIDLSAPALAIAQQNAERNGVASRIRFLHGDLLSPVAGERFDFVVSNPPYVPAADRASLSVEVRDYEPQLALFAGEDGLDIYRRLIPAAFASLTSGGCAALEIGYGQETSIRTLLMDSGFEQIEFVHDLQNIARVACGRRL